jgi:hypothetical protein
MATDRVQITAVVPAGLKRTAFARFALADTTFSRWLREELRKYANSAPEPEDKTGQSQGGEHDAE